MTSRLWGAIIECLSEGAEREVGVTGLERFSQAALRVRASKIPLGGLKGRERRRSRIEVGWGEKKVLIERPLWPNVVQYFVTGLARIDVCQEAYRLCYKLSTRVNICVR